MSDDGLNLLSGLDYSALQQCMHCGLCLPTCPTYDATLSERSSPRGRIAMMRAIADGELEASKTFAEEMYFCLGCLACQTACPAGVDYAALFENARAEVERQGLLDGTVRNFVRRWVLGWLFAKQTRLRTLQLYRRDLQQANPPAPRYRVALLAGCVQDISFAEVNADTICVLQHNGCQVLLPEGQACCGSLHAHNGAVEQARQQARLNIDAFDAENLDAIVVNAGGCGLHCKHYDRLLADDPTYAERAVAWSEKVKDVHEWLADIGLRQPRAAMPPQQVAYHESCHLKHGQRVSAAPREVLQAVPNLELVPLAEADWCCGSAGIYNITQPELSMQLLDRKMAHVCATGATAVATGNTGCAIQLQYGVRRAQAAVDVVHPVSLLAAAYRAENQGETKCSTSV